MKRKMFSKTNTF